MKNDSFDGETSSEYWRLDYLFEIVMRGAVIHATVAVITMASLLGTVSNITVYIWSTTMVALSFCLAVLGTLYRRYGLSPKAPLLLGAAHTAIVGFIGLTWGMGSLAIGREAPELLLFYSFALGGTAMGAVNTQHSLLRSCMTSIWTSIPILALSFAIYLQNELGLSMAILILLYGATLSVIAKRMNHFLRENRRLAEGMADKVRALTDLTDNLEKAKRHTDKIHQNKSDLLAQLSHDLRHPVHAIGLYVETLRCRSNTPESRRTIDKIDMLVEAMGRLLKTLLDLSALESGRIEPKKTVTSLDKLLFDATEAFTQRDDGHRLKVVSHSSHIETDPALLRTMVQNLVDNAFRYGGSGRILVGCRKRQGSVSIEVHNQGVGIAPGNINRIIEPFTRLEPLDLGQGEGMGLGLHIVHRMADLLGLTFRIQSAPKLGTIAAIDGLPEAIYADSTEKPDGKTYTSLLSGFRVTAVSTTTAPSKSLVPLLKQWGCDISVQKTLAPVEGQTDFLLVEWPDSEFLGLYKLMETLPKIPTLVTLPERDDGQISPTLPAQATILHRPIAPHQLRSLLLTAAKKAENKP